MHHIHVCVCYGCASTVYNIHVCMHYASWMQSFMYLYMLIYGLLARESANSVGLGGQESLQQIATAACHWDQGGVLGGGVWMCLCVNTWILTLEIVWGLCLCMLWSSSSLSYVHPCIVSYGCHTCCCLTGCGFSCNTCWWLGVMVFRCMEIHVSHVVSRLSPTRKRQCEQWLLPR